MKYLKRESHKVVITKEQHLQNTMRAAKKRRMNKKRMKFAIKLNDEAITIPLPLLKALKEEI